MDWFRMYNEFSSDAKVQSMTEAMQRRLVMLLCLRCSNALVTLHETEIAFALRITDEELAQTKVLFLRKGFINDDWKIENWDKRQFASDSSAPRVAKHRAKVKALQEQVSNVTVTTQNRTDTEQNRTDTEKEKITPAAPKKPKLSCKTSLPIDFRISARVQQWAGERQISNLQAHFENFVSACKAKGYTYADWDEALMGAVRNDWAKLAQARAGPAKQEKFDPLAYVNRNRIQKNERTIDLDASGEPH